jgi:hypothetical protein
MNSRSLVRITLLCVLPLTSMACGYLFVNGPPPNHERLNFFTCTQSRAAPGIDAVWTGGVAIIIVSVLVSSDAEVETSFGNSKGAVVAIYGPWGAATALSAVSGFKKVNQCRNATALLMERLSRPPDTPSATPSLGALGWRPPLLSPVSDPLDPAPITSPRPKPEASPGN